MKIFIVLFYVFILFESAFCEAYQSMKISDSTDVLNESSVVVDSEDDIHVFWVDNSSIINYRYSKNSVWSDIKSIYCADQNSSIENLCSECTNDTCYVFWTQSTTDSFFISNIRVYQHYQSEIDSIYSSKYQINKLRSAYSGNQISIGWLETSDSEYDAIVTVYEYTNSKFWQIDSCDTYSSITLGYDSKNSLWVYWLNGEYSINFKHLINNEYWSESVYIYEFDGMYMDITCKYNEHKNVFHLVLPGELYSGPIDNGLFYFEGYDSTWSERETIIPSGSDYTFWSYTISSVPEIEITSSGECKVFFHNSFCAGDLGPYDSEDVCFAEKVDSTWEYHTPLPFDSTYFYSSAINSKDSLYFTYGRSGELHLAYKESPNAISNNGNLIFPFVFEIYGNYPNPFNSGTKLSFYISVASKIKIDIYDVLGRKVMNLVNKKNDGGVTEVFWDARARNGLELPSGMYFYYGTITNEYGSFSFKDKMLLLK